MTYHPIGRQFDDERTDMYRYDKWNIARNGIQSSVNFLFNRILIRKYEDQQTTTKSFLRYLQDIIFPNVFVCNTETIIMLLPDPEHFRYANVNNLLPYSDLKND